MATVVLDAGHGGYDAGAVNGSRYEKNDNLRLVLAVGQILRNCGVNVVYTRSTDVFVPLLERSAISNNVRPNLFVSIHRNSSTNITANGVENWVYSSPSQNAVAAADKVLKSVVAAGVQSNRGIKYGNYSVLRHTTAPAMLLEMGFISNTEDNNLFDQRFDAYAQAIANGILSHLGVSCGSVTPPVTPPTTIPPTSDYTAMIRYIQQTLNSRYDQNLVTDGIWGPQSQRSLMRAYQMELNRQYNAGLVEDGVWGPATSAATRLIRQGARGNLVWILQAALFVNGYPVSPDGIFGAQTDAQLRAFQRANGLGADGIAGPATFRALFVR